MGSERISRKKSTFLHNTDYLLGLLGILVSVALLTYSIIGHLSPLYILIGILVAFSCSYWLLFRKKVRDKELIDNIGERPDVNLILASVFFLLFTLSILCLYLRPQLYERPLEYFVLTSLMAGVVALETLHCKGRWVSLVLVQVIIIGLSLAWSQLLIFPGLMQSDPWYHQLLTSFAQDEGKLPVSFAYSSIPLFHLLVGSASFIFHVDYKTAMILSVSFAQVLINTLSIYLLGTFLTKSPKVGMLAVLFLAISDHEILMSTIAIPASYAAIFVPIVIYILLRMRDNRGLAVLTSAFLLLTIVLSHTVTSVWIGIALFVGVVASKLIKVHDREKKVTSLTILTFFLTIMFGWWAYASGVLDTLSEFLDLGFNKSSIEPTNMLINIPVSEQILIAAGLYILFALSIIGILYMVARKDRTFSFEMAFILVTPLIIGFISMATGIFVNQQRWFYYAQIVLAIPMAISVYLLIGLPSRSKIKMMTMSGFVMILAFLMITGGIANTDNHILSSTAVVRGGLTEGELTAVHTSDDMWPHPAVDVRYADAFLVVSGYNYTVIDDYLLEKNFSGAAGYMVLIRESIEKGTFPVRGGLYNLDYNPEEVLSAQGFSKVYQGGGVKGYMLV